MPDYYFHYTSMYHAQGILSIGRIRPGRGGDIFLTDRLYNTGAEASNELGVGHKVIEACFAIPASGVADAIGPEQAAPWNDTRVGGGPEYTTGNDIDITRAAVVLVRLP